MKAFTYLNYKIYCRFVKVWQLSFFLLSGFTIPSRQLLFIITETHRISSPECGRCILFSGPFSRRSPGSFRPPLLNQNCSARQEILPLPGQSNLIDQVCRSSMPSLHAPAAKGSLSAGQSSFRIIFSTRSAQVSISSMVTLPSS